MRNISNKKGLSTVVTTLIIILLVLVAIGLLWVVIRPLLEGGAGSIESQTNCLEIDMEIASVTGPCGLADCQNIVVKRNVGGGAIDGIRATVTGTGNGGNTVSDFDDINGNLGELTSKTIAVIYSFEITPQQVTIAPYFINDEGEKVLCPVADTVNAPFT